MGIGLVDAALLRAIDISLNHGLSYQLIAITYECIDHD
jgi:hypothetical protein